MLQQLRNGQPKTQKARGLRGLILGKDCPGELDYNFGHIAWIKGTETFGGYLDSMLIHTLFYNNSIYPGSDTPIIARPCPVTPRHGFVESRIVQTVGELRQVCKETLAADPRGEVLLMPFLKDETHSGVLTNQGLSMGSGHDGATAGKDAVLIPCISNIAKWIDSQLGDIFLQSPRASVRVSRSRYIGYTKDPKRQPYLELVGNVIVQARYGPMAQVGATSYHPRGKSQDMFSHIWEPSQTLLADFELFEKTLKEQLARAKDNGGHVCLYLPYGTLSCHAAVQGICYGAAVVTGFQRPESNTFVSFTPADKVSCNLLSVIRGIGDGLILGRKTDLTRLKWPKTVPWAAAVIQGMAGVPITPQSSKFLAAATTILLRAGLMACFGEHRHYSYFNSSGDTQTPIGPISPGMKSPLVQKHVKASRSTYYTHLCKPTVLKDKSLYELLGRVQAIESDFSDNRWQSMVGGAAWATCTQAVKHLLIAYIRLRYKVETSPPALNYTFRVDGHTAKELRACIGAANKLLTVSHNNGRCLTKFVSKSILAGVTHAPGIYLMHPLTQEVLNDSATIPTECKGVTPETDKTMS